MRLTLALLFIAACTAPPGHSLRNDDLAATASPVDTAVVSTTPTPTPTLVEPEIHPGVSSTTAASSEQWDRSVVRIRVVSCAGVGTGTGFLIDNATIITARHVVADARKIQVETWDGKDLEVAEARQASVVDLGIIKLAAPIDVPPLVVSATESQPKDRVFAIGYPEGNELKTTEGTVLGYFNDMRYGSLGRIMRFTAPIKPGNSGGPLLSLEGEVVGVVYAIDLNNQDSLAVPAATLRRLIEGDYEPAVVRPC